MLPITPLREHLERIVNGGTYVDDHLPMIEELREAHRHSITRARLNATVGYNCFAHGLGVIESPRVYELLRADAVRDDPIGVKCGVEFVERLLNGGRLVPNPEGPIVVYFRNGRPVHAGLVQDDIVTSKWGIGLLWRHEFNEVPVSYGDEYRRYEAPAVAVVENEFEHYAAALRNNKIWSIAWDTLRAHNGITDAIIEAELVFRAQNVPDTKSRMVRGMLESAKNRRHLSSVIGDLERLGPCLFDFDPRQIINHFENWENVCDAIEQSGVVATPIRREGKKASWPTMSKAILSIARYVERFDTAADFQAYAGEFLHGSLDLRIGLPLIMGSDIHGYGFALACDFLKENISPLFVKPDTHIIKIFQGINISASDASDVQVFRDVVRFAESIGQTPYAVDKLFWMIGTGNFYNNGIKRPSRRAAFVRRINEFLR